jgi:anti-sigma regulatory factor (Ser/Thr protein kinase)
MSGLDETLMALTVPCAPTASAAVREQLSRLDGLGWVLGDVMLVASELVNNAVVHSGGLPHHDLQVCACRHAEHLTISVRDPGLSGGSAGRMPPSAEKAGGWGLRIVEQLCERWGEERRDGYRVWAEINVPISAIPPGLGQQYD